MAEQQGTTLTDVDDVATIDVPESENGAAAIQLHGSTDSFVVEGTVDGANFEEMYAYNPTTDSMEATMVAPGIWRVELAGLVKLQVRKTVGTDDTRVTLVTRRG